MKTIQHLLMVDHASSAVDNKPIFIDVFRKVVTGGNINFNIKANSLSKPAGYFQSSNIIGLGMVGTSFSYQNFVRRLRESITRTPSTKVVKSLFRANKIENWSRLIRGGQWQPCENLRVGDHQTRGNFCLLKFQLIHFLWQ